VQHSPLQTSRALARLRQLAREEALAVEHGDVGALCRIAQLLPDATAALQNETAPRTDEHNAGLQEIFSAHSKAEDFLHARMAQTADELRRCAFGRKASHAYSGKLVKSTGRLDNTNG
jgi:hypothetical protein